MLCSFPSAECSERPLREDYTWSVQARATQVKSVKADRLSSRWVICWLRWHLPGPMSDCGRPGIRKERALPLPLQGRKSPEPRYGPSVSEIKLQSKLNLPFCVPRAGGRPEVPRLDVITQTTTQEGIVERIEELSPELKLGGFRETKREVSEE